MAKKRTEDFQNQNDFEAGYQQDPSVMPPSGGYQPAPKPTPKKPKSPRSRGTYYLYEDQLEAVRMKAFEERIDISEAMRNILDEYFGEEKLQEARERIGATNRQ